MHTLTRDDLMDMLHGAAILGTGGGGEISEGIGLIDEALALGKRFRLADLSEAPANALLCTPYMLGALSDLPPSEATRYDGLPEAETHPILLAYDRFEAYLGAQFWGTVPCELGGSNSAIAFYAAAMRDVVMCDADPAGRAVPEITHSTYFFAGLPAAPIVMVNAFGEAFIAENVQDDQRAETLVRALSIASRNDIAAIDHALPAATLSSALLHGTISQAMQMGAIWRAGLAEPATVPERIAEAGGGDVAFRGAVRACAYETQGGFTVGAVEVAGEDGDAGHSYKIDVKNENMAGWRDGALHATIPDLICMLDLETGDPVTHPNVAVGQRLGIVILPAQGAFTTEAALKVFGPAYLGLPGPYRPAVG